MPRKDKEKDRAYGRKYYTEHREELCAYRAAHREEKQAYHKIYNAAHREEKCTKSKIYRATHSEEKHTREIARKFSMTREDYDNMFTAQNGVCAICDKSPNGKRLSVDHDHNTGEVRGLLCDNCNRSLGLTHDSIEILEKAIEYLKEQHRPFRLGGNHGGER